MDLNGLKLYHAADDGQLTVTSRPRNKSGRYTPVIMTCESLYLPVTAEFIPVIVIP